jgi:hypothetical protein
LISVVCWKWSAPGYRSTFTGAHVNALERMVARHYQHPHRVICVTNEPEGIDPSIEWIVDDADFSELPSPHGGMMPSCYRRLRMWRPDIAEWFGERFISIDLDVVLTDDVSPLWNRTEDVVLYRDPLYPTQYCGSMALLTAGARPEVWESFDPEHSPQIARGAGFRGSDQAWISLRLPGEATWGPEHGVYSFRKDILPSGIMPKDARMVICHGQHDPWGAKMQALPWVREHWC